MPRKTALREPGTKPAAGRGRPRDPEVDRLISRATLELIGEVGYDRMSIEGVSARSGVAKTTIYRRFPGKPELVLGALRSYEPAEAGAPPDTGTLRGDLIAVFPRLLLLSSFGQEQGLIMVGLMQALRGNAELSEYMRARFVSSMNHSVDIVMERAIARGEIPAAARDIRLFREIVPSLSLSRILTGEPVDEAFGEELIDTVLIPLLRSAVAAEAAGL